MQGIVKDHMEDKGQQGKTLSMGWTWWSRGRQEVTDWTKGYRKWQSASSWTRGPGDKCGHRLDKEVQEKAVIQGLNKEKPRKAGSHKLDNTDREKIGGPGLHKVDQEKSGGHEKSDWASKRSGS